MITTVAANDRRLHDLWFPAMTVVVPLGTTRIVRPGRVPKGAADAFAALQRYFDYKQLVVAAVVRSVGVCVHDITTTADYDDGRQMLAARERMRLLSMARTEAKDLTDWIVPDYAECNSFAELMLTISGVPVGDQVIIKPANTTIGRGSMHWLAVHGYAVRALQAHRADAN